MHLTELDSVLLVNEVGSTMWGMQKSDSDVDYFCLWGVNPEKLLNGKHAEGIRAHRTKMVHHEYPGCETGIMEATEVAHQIHLLLDSNVNAVQRTLSSVVHHSTPESERLAELVQEHRAKNIFHSVNGMNSHNLKRYWKRVEEEGEEFGSKKAGQIMRVVECAIRVLDGKKYTFDPVYGATLEDCNNALERLQLAYDGSDLPEEPSEEPFREWLLDLRLQHLHERGIQ